MASEYPRSSYPRAPLGLRRMPLTLPEQRLCIIAAVLAALAILGTLFNSELAALGTAQGVLLNAHGHTHLYAHGHPFVDARTLWGIPNAMDVLSNLPFAFFGVWGLWRVLRVRTLPTATRIASSVFFAGFILTCAGSSFYHWTPDAWGLALDRAGMACAFAGVLGLAIAERVSLRAVHWAWGSVFITAMLSIALNYVAGAIAPWAVVQFGGMAVVLWAATLRAQPGALAVRWGVVIAIYALAKLLEMGDAAVFHLTQEWISGHSLKHIAASLAALPVIIALRHNE
jgi:hypothetical protein